MSFLRAEKSTPNSNAVRVLIPGMFATLFLMVVADPALTLWDTAIRDRPWLTSVLEINTAREYSHEPTISDRITLDYSVYGIRNVWSEDVAGYRLCGASRQDSWDHPLSRVWSWDGFFNNNCPVPERPFRVCTGYHLFTARGAESTAGPYCSAMVTAFAPAPEIEQ